MNKLESEDFLLGDKAIQLLRDNPYKTNYTEEALRLLLLIKNTRNHSVFLNGYSKEDEGLYD